VSRAAAAKPTVPASTTIAAPFFEIGPKNLLRLPQVVELAIAAGDAGVRHGVSVILTVPTAMIAPVQSAAPHVFVFAQGMDLDRPGASVGRTIPEALADAGARGVMLNHDSNPLAPEDLAPAIGRAQENGLMTMVCAGSDDEVRSLLPLGPTIVLYEPPALIGVAGGGDRPWIGAIDREAAATAPDVLMMHAGGVSQPDDAYRIMGAGAHGTGSTSGVVRHDRPLEAAERFIEATRRGYESARSQKTA
jgi:triosephosphate isomerase